MKKIHEEEKKLSKADIKAKIDDAKKEAASKFKNANDIKKFLDKNKKKIDDVANSLKGNSKKQFKQIIDALNDNIEEKSLNENETSMKWLSGIAAFIIFAMGYGAFPAAIAASPAFLPAILKKIAEKFD